MKRQISLILIVSALSTVANGWTPPSIHCIWWNGYGWVAKCQNGRFQSPLGCCPGETPEEDTCCVTWSGEICCNHQCVVPDPNHDCCDNRELYNTDTHECCGGKVIAKCDPDKCESCIDGECKVCDGDPNLACHNGHCCCAPNGCGSCGGIDIIPDNPAGCSDTSFLEVCNTHDSCYGECGSNKDTCDGVFLGEAEPPTGMLGICIQSSCAYACSEAAYTYYGAVHNEGQSAYDAAQSCSCGY